MFECVILDADLTPDGGEGYSTRFIPESEREREKLLVPFLYLIADRVVVTRPYKGKQEIEGKKTDFVKMVQDVPQGRPHVMDMAANGEGVLFTTEAWRKASVLERQGITMKNSLLILAAAGLQVSVPNLSFDVACSDEVSIVRENLSEERQSYLATITRMADESFDRLTSGVYVDTVDWALNEAILKVQPKALEFENAMKKLDQHLLKRLGVHFVRDAIPSIGSVMARDGLAAGASQALEEVLKVLCVNLARNMEERRSPEVVYGYNVKKRLKL